VKPAKKLLSSAVRLLVCGLLLAWIFHTIFLNEAKLHRHKQGGNWESLTRAQQWSEAWSVGPQELWHNLSHIDPGPLLLSLVFMGLTILLGIIRWRMVLRVQGLNLPFTRAAEISLVAHFFNSFLLGSTGGDVLKAYYAARETHHKKTEAVTTVFVDRIIGLFSMLLFACLMMLPNLELLTQHRRLGAIAAFVIMMTAGCGLVVYLAFWGGLSQRWPSARERLRRLPKGEMLERSLDSCRQFGREKSFLFKAVGWSMLLNTICVLQIWALASGLHLKIPITSLFVIVPIIICISALPITPSGLGVRENLYVAMLAVKEIGVPDTMALSLSLLAYAGSLFWSLIGGVVYASLKQSQHLEEVTRPADESDG
jgi:uncharacterized protein (TIRG00374 family)